MKKRPGQSHFNKQFCLFFWMAWMEVAATSLEKTNSEFAKNKDDDDEDGDCIYLRGHKYELKYILASPRYNCAKLFSPRSQPPGSVTRFG